MENCLSLRKLLKIKRLQIVIIPHHSPDADALGSALGLSSYLRKIGHHTEVISPNEYPSFLAWMPGAKDIIEYEKDRSQAKKALHKAELLFFVDFSAMKRMGAAMQAEISASTAPRALIDHHPEPEEDMAQYRFWSSEAAATAELVFELICAAQDEALIDTNIAECLYAGILTDTGSFRFSTVTARIHHIVAHLIEQGNLSVEKISDRLYGNYSLERMQFLGFALSHCLTVYPELHTAFFVLKAKDMQRFHPKTGDTEGLVNYALSIKGIQLGVLIKELNNEVRLSFRSKGNFSVNDMAKAHFNGGGHRNAAGGTCQEALHKVVRRFEALLPTYRVALAAATTETQHP